MTKTDQAAKELNTLIERRAKDVLVDALGWIADRDSDAPITARDLHNLRQQLRRELGEEARQ